MARKEPQNIEAEISVLGCGFLDNKDALEKIMDEVTEDMFYSEANRIIFKAMRKLHENGTAVDVNTVSNELDKDKSLAKVGGVEYITELTDSVPSVANLDYYINILFEKSILRNLITVSNEIQESCYDEQDELVEIVENAERNILNVYKDKMGRDVKRIQDVLPELQKEIEALADAKTDFTGIRTGFYDFDRMTSGLQKNQVIIVSGRPGSGKSAFALNVALNAAIKEKKSVAYFSLEMSAEELTKRMFGCLGKIDGEVIKTGKLKNTDWQRWNEAYSRLADCNFTIEDSGDLTVAEIRRRCRKLKNTKEGLDLVVIDYLSLLSSSSKYAGQRVNEVGEMSRDVKRLAMELEIPVILLAQLNRSIDSRKGEDAKPKLSDLRESGSIENDADIVLFLYSEDYGKYEVNKSRKVELLVAKHRAGQTGKVDLIFKMNTGSFENFSNRDDVNE